MLAKKKLKIIRDAPNKYHFETKDDRHVDIEHKDKHIKFKLHKWNKEASFEVSLNMVEAESHKFSGNKIEVEDSKKKIRVYPIDTRSTTDFYGDTQDQVQCHDGGLRFELVLRGKPIVNSFTASVVSKNLRFSLQPFLTKQDIAEGVTRPLNVEDSYAVYHISKKSNQYMTGKAFHIYRPIAEDALGVKAWCSIRFDKCIDPTSLTLTIPQQFLDEATYPVTIDPDFGYMAEGGTSFTIGASPIKSPYYNRGGSAWPVLISGTANYIRAYIGSSSAGYTAHCTVFINQKDSGGAGTHGQIAGPVQNLNCGGDPHWEEFTLADEELTQDINYILNIYDSGGHGADYSYYLMGDVNGAVASYWETATAESPWVVDPEGTTIDYSIYCNYSPPPVTAVTIQYKLIFGE